MAVVIPLQLILLTLTVLEKHMVNNYFNWFLTIFQRVTQKSSKWLAIYLRSLECLLKLIRPPIFGKFGQFSSFGSKDLATYPAKLTKTLKTRVLVIVMYCWALILSSIWAQIRRSSLHGCYLCARDVARGNKLCVIAGTPGVRNRDRKISHNLSLFSRPSCVSRSSR